MPMPTGRCRTYRSKKNESGIIDHKDILPYTNNKSTLFDAYSMQNIKKFKRKNSYMPGLTDGTISKNVTKKKVVKRLRKEVLLQTITNNFESMTTPKKENVDPFDNLSTQSAVQTPVVLTPDLSLHVKRLSADPFDKLWNSRQEQNREAIPTMDPRVNLSSDDDSLSVNCQEKSHVTYVNNCNADKYDNIYISDDGIEKKDLEGSPVMPIRKRSKLKKRKVLNKFLRTNKNATSDSSHEFYDHKLNVENATQKGKNTSLSLTQILKNVQTMGTKNKSFSSRNHNSSFLKSPQGSANTLHSSTPRKSMMLAPSASSYRSIFRGSIANLSPVPSRNVHKNVPKDPETENKTQELDKLKKNYTKASPPIFDKSGTKKDEKPESVVDKEYTSIPVVASAASASTEGKNSRSNVCVRNSNMSIENIIATSDSAQDNFPTTTNVDNLIVSPNQFESFSQSISISCDEHFQWKRKEEMKDCYSVDGNIIPVPPDFVKVPNDHSAIEADNNFGYTSNYKISHYDTPFHSEHNLQSSIEINSMKVNLSNLPVGNSLSNNNMKSEKEFKSAELICNDSQVTLSDDNSHESDRSSHEKKLRESKKYLANTNACLKREDNLLKKKKNCKHIDNMNESVLEKCTKSRKLSDETSEKYTFSDRTSYSIDSDLTKSFYDDKCRQTAQKTDDSLVSIGKQEKCNDLKLDVNVETLHDDNTALSHHSLLSETCDSKCHNTLDNFCSIQSEPISRASLTSTSKNLDNDTTDSYRSIEDRFAWKPLCVNAERLNESGLQKYAKCQELNCVTENSSISSQSLLLDTLELKGSDTLWNNHSLSIKSKEKNIRKTLQVVNIDGLNDFVHKNQKYAKRKQSNNETVENSLHSDNSSEQVCREDAYNSNTSADIKLEDKVKRYNKNLLLFSPKLHKSRLKSIDTLKYVECKGTIIKSTENSFIEDLKLPIEEKPNNLITNRKKIDSNASLLTIQEDYDIADKEALDLCKNNTIDDDYVESNVIDGSYNNDHDDSVLNKQNRGGSLHCVKTPSTEKSFNSIFTNNSKTKSDFKPKCSRTGRNTPTCDKQRNSEIEIKETSNNRINKSDENITKILSPITITGRITRSKKNSKSDVSLLEDFTCKQLNYNKTKPQLLYNKKPINNQVPKPRESINLRTRRVVCQNTINKIPIKKKTSKKLEKICESENPEITNEVSRMSIWEKDFDYAVDDEIKRISDMHLFKVPNVFTKQKDNIDHKNKYLPDTSIVLLPGKRWKKSLSIVRRMSVMSEERNETCSEEIQSEDKTFRESLTSVINLKSPLKGRKYRESVSIIMNLQSPLKAAKYRTSLAAVIELQPPLNGRKYRQSAALDVPINEGKNKKTVTDVMDIQPPLNTKKDWETGEVIDLQSPQDERKYRKSTGTSHNCQSLLEERKCEESVANVIEIQSFLNRRNSRECNVTVIDLQSPGDERKYRKSTATLVDCQSPLEGRRCRESMANITDMQSSLNGEDDFESKAFVMDSQSPHDERKWRESRATLVEMETQGFLSETCNDTAINFSSLSISDDEASCVIEKSIDTSHCERLTTAKDVVLQRCNQTNAIPFNQCYTDVDLKNCRKIGEGVYGEVFLFRAQDGGVRVMKVIPVAGDIKVNGEPQKTFEEILSEIVIAMELSALRTPMFDDSKENSDADAEVERERINISSSVENATDTFNQVLGVHCVIGSYPSRLLDLWDLYDETRGSENDSPAELPQDQQYIVLELANAGQDLESYQFNNAEQALALFYQVAYALAVAEENCQFEHRDLHWGNVLIAPTDDKTVRFVLRGQEHRLASCGIRGTIIDYSLSRLSLQLGEDAALYSDLARDPGLFDAVGDYQFDIYRLMRERNGNTWKEFEPYTNILWLHYTLDKMITALRYKRTNTKLHKHYIAKLKDLKGQILNYQSCVQFVLEDGKH